MWYYLANVRACKRMNRTRTQCFVNRHTTQCTHFRTNNEHVYFPFLCTWKCARKHYVHFGNNTWSDARIRFIHKRRTTAHQIIYFYYYSFFHAGVGVWCGVVVTAECDLKRNGYSIIRFACYVLLLLLLFSLTLCCFKVASFCCMHGEMCCCYGGNIALFFMLSFWIVRKESKALQNMCTYAKCCIYYTCVSANVFAV